MTDIGRYFKPLESMSGKSDNQLIVLKINQTNGIKDEIIIGLHDDANKLAVTFVNVSNIPPVLIAGMS